MPSQSTYKIVYIVIIPSVSKTDLLIHPVPQPYQTNNFIVLKVFSDLASRLYMRSEVSYGKTKQQFGWVWSHNAGGRCTLPVVIKTMTHTQLNTFLSWQPNTETNIIKFLNPQSVSIQIHTKHHKSFSLLISTAVLCHVMTHNRKVFFC
jgi:hypothetical protein